MKNSVTQVEVNDFKTTACDENSLISNIIKLKAYPYFVEPILDVGAGSGDIAYRAMHSKKVICIDKNKITQDDFPLSENHQRIQTDFFEYMPSEPINTIFLCHVLQFLDDDVSKLNNKINELNAEFVITVVNDNNDFLGEIVKWTMENYPLGNPEMALDNFPLNYVLCNSFPFKTDIVCKDFEELTKHISYLMLIDCHKTKLQLNDFLRANLTKPEFTFNQSIQVYQKVD